MKPLKALFNFIVGDTIILIGVTITIILLALIEYSGFLAPLRAIDGALLILAVLAVLVITLSREARGKH